MSAQRPSTRPAGVWQPVQQANGRDVRGRGAVGVPARQRSVEAVVRPARTVSTPQPHAADPPALGPRGCVTRPGAFQPCAIHTSWSDWRDSSSARRIGATPSARHSS